MAMMGSFNELVLNYYEPGTVLYLGIIRGQVGQAQLQKDDEGKKENIAFLSNFCVLVMAPHASYMCVINFGKQS